VNQPPIENRTGKEGYTILIVLVALGFISSFSVLIAYYGQWQAQVQSIEENFVKLGQAERFASGWTRNYLKETLPDSPVLEPVRREWSLDPDVTVRIRLKSLNAKIGLNRLNDQNTTQDYVQLVDGILTEMNYPDRTTEELIRWMTPAENREGGSGQYAGYGYSPPGREIRQIDEVQLISGFREIGLKEKFRKIFTVHGSGDLNPLHFSPEQWKLLEGNLGEDLPRIPSAALQNERTLRQYLKQDPVWDELSGTYDFFTREDDSFLATYYLEEGGVVRRAREVLKYDGESENVDRRTRYTIDPSETSGISTTENGSGSN
jgi:hypothetical protein